MINETVILLIRLLAIFVVILPMTISALAIYIRYKRDEDDDIMYRKWRIASKIITIPAFVFALALFMLMLRSVAILFFPTKLFDPLVLADYGVKNWLLVLFLIFWFILFIVSMYAAYRGWRYGDDHSDYEFSSWFLRVSSRVEVLDEEQQIKISWAMTYSLLPKAIVLYFIAILFAIAPSFFTNLTVKAFEYAVPTQLEELSKKMENGSYIDCDENYDYYIHWKQYSHEFFESNPEFAHQYKAKVWSITYTFNEDGKLVDIDVYDALKQKMKNEIGTYATLDKYGFFCFPLSNLPLERISFEVIPPTPKSLSKQQINIYVPQSESAQAQ